MAVKRELVTATLARKAEKRTAQALNLTVENTRRADESAASGNQPTKEILELSSQTRKMEQPVLLDDCISPPPGEMSQKFSPKPAEANNTTIRWDRK